MNITSKVRSNALSEWATGYFHTCGFVYTRLERVRLSVLGRPVLFSPHLQYM